MNQEHVEYNKIFMQKKDIFKGPLLYAVTLRDCLQDPKAQEPECVFETHDIHDMLSVKEEPIFKEVFFFIVLTTSYSKLSWTGNYQDPELIG